MTHIHKDTHRHAHIKHKRSSWSCAVTYAHEIVRYLSSFSWSWSVQYSVICFLSLFKEEKETLMKHLTSFMQNCYNNNWTSSECEKTRNILILIHDTWIHTKMKARTLMILANWNARRGELHLNEKETKKNGWILMCETCYGNAVLLTKLIDAHQIIFKKN